MLFRLAPTVKGNLSDPEAIPMLARPPTLEHPCELMGRHAISQASQKSADADSQPQSYPLTYYAVRETVKSANMHLTITNRST
jgi:hypothetical protein